MKDQSYKRHIVKTLTWRVIGTIDTMLIAWWISESPLMGLKIGFAEVITKMVLYYLHERAWFKINLLRNGHVLKSKIRHLIKTVTWRVIGTLDTMLLAWWISNNPLTGLKIGFVEVTTKMILYYLHERFWYKLNFGLAHRN